MVIGRSYAGSSGIQRRTSSSSESTPSLASSATPIAVTCFDVEPMSKIRQITSDHADCVIAQCREEHRMLGDHLQLLDAAIAECGKF